jgi:hypothetical protein
MNFARTALFLVVLSFSAGAAEPGMANAQHAAVDEAAVATTQARPELRPEDVNRYNAAVNACMPGRQDFGAPNPGMAPVATAR